MNLVIIKMLIRGNLCFPLLIRNPFYKEAISVRRQNNNFLSVCQRGDRLR